MAFRKLEGATWDENRKRIFSAFSTKSEIGDQWFHNVYRSRLENDTIECEKVCSWSFDEKSDDRFGKSTAVIGDTLYITTVGKVNRLWKANANTLEKISEVKLEKNTSKPMILCAYKTELLVAVEKEGLIVLKDDKWLKIKHENFPKGATKMCVSNDILFVACEVEKCIKGFQLKSDPLTLGNVVWGPISTKSTDHVLTLLLIGLLHPTHNKIIDTFTITTSGILVVRDVDNLSDWLLYDTKAKTNKPKRLVRPFARVEPTIEGCDPELAVSDKLVLTAFPNTKVPEHSFDAESQQIKDITQTYQNNLVYDVNILAACWCETRKRLYYMAKLEQESDGHHNTFCVLTRATIMDKRFNFDEAENAEDAYKHTFDHPIVQLSVEKEYKWILPKPVESMVIAGGKLFILSKDGLSDAKDQNTLCEADTETLKPIGKMECIENFHKENKDSKLGFQITGDETNLLISVFNDKTPSNSYFNVIDVTGERLMKNSVIDTYVGKDGKEKKFKKLSTKGVMLPHGEEMPNDICLMRMTANEVYMSTEDSLLLVGFKWDSKSPSLTELVSGPFGFCVGLVEEEILQSIPSNHYSFAVTDEKNILFLTIENEKKEACKEQWGVYSFEENGFYSTRVDPLFTRDTELLIQDKAPRPLLALPQLQNSYGYFVFVTQYGLAVAQ